MQSGCTRVIVCTIEQELDVSVLKLSPKLAVSLIGRDQINPACQASASALVETVQYVLFFPSF